mmetsp:Transcript_75694/g.244946  ORF Transcript_75694/g.244946 Transcript_75694/m.244946 type:complete len:233 (+) Transcript_75694:531-1229(+)
MRLVRSGGHVPRQGQALARPDSHRQAWHRHGHRRRLQTLRPQSFHSEPVLRADTPSSRIGRSSRVAEAPQLRLQAASGGWSLGWRTWGLHASAAEGVPSLQAEAADLGDEGLHKGRGLRRRLPRGSAALAGCRRGRGVAQRCPAARKGLLRLQGSLQALGLGTEAQCLTALKLRLRLAALQPGLRLLPLSSRLRLERAELLPRLSQLPLQLSLLAQEFASEALRLGGFVPGS